jgi:hypothetical protein
LKQRSTAFTQHFGIIIPDQNLQSQQRDALPATKPRDGACRTDPSGLARIGEQTRQTRNCLHARCTDSHPFGTYSPELSGSINLAAPHRFNLPIANALTEHLRIL